MTGMLRFVMCLVLLGCGFAGALPGQAQTESVRKERRLINEGNKLYGEKKYREAAKKYESALEINSSSAVAAYNLGLTRMVLGSNPADTTEKARKLLEEGKNAMQNVAAMGQTHPQLAANANYNLGNVAFNANDYAGAIQSYKEALRLAPGDNNARRNLRIAQLKQQQNQDNKDNKDNKDNQDNKDQNKDQNKDNKDQDQNKQDQNDQNQNQDKNDKQPPRQNQGGGINEQTADQILKAMENKENQTRGRVGNAQKAKGARSRSNKNW